MVQRGKQEEKGQNDMKLGPALPSCSPFYAKLQCRTGRGTRIRHGGILDLSSLTGDQTGASGIGSTES